MVHMEFNPDFGKRIRELRHREGKMSLRELARRVCISPSYLSQIEQGKLPPTTNALLIIRLAQELNENPIELKLLARRPDHTLSELLSDHPEIPNLLADTFSEIEEKHINSVIVSISLQMLVAEEYGKYIKKPEQDELEALSEQVQRIHRILRERNRTR